jgi:hypothetical protein
MAIASAGLIAGLERTVRVFPARSGQLPRRVAGLLSSLNHSEPIAKAG